MAEAYICGDFCMKNLQLFLGLSVKKEKKKNMRKQEETTAALLSTEGREKRKKGGWRWHDISCAKLFHR